MYTHTPHAYICVHSLLMCLSAFLTNSLMNVFLYQSIRAFGILMPSFILILCKLD